MRVSSGRWTVAALVLVAACGGDGDDVASSVPGSTQVTSTTAVEGGGDWCGELRALERSRDEDLTSDAIAGAPDAIRAPLDTLVELSEVDATNPPPGSRERGVRAVADIESWSHQHCGGDHPFCSLWISVNGAMAAPAFVDEEQQGAAEAELRSLLDDLDQVLLDVAPTDLRDEVETILSWFSGAGDGAQLSDEDERVAEAAEAALDEWAWSEGCEGARDVSDE